jgi:hypothetical protein
MLRETHVTLPELGLVGMTRAAAGAGIALLLADRLSADQRRALGWGLFLLGALTTIPLAAELLGKSHSVSECGRRQGAEAVGAGAGI